MSKTATEVYAALAQLAESVSALQSLLTQGTTAGTVIDQTPQVIDLTRTGARTAGADRSNPTVTDFVRRGLGVACTNADYRTGRTHPDTPWLQVYVTYAMMNQVIARSKGAHSSYKEHLAAAFLRKGYRVDVVTRHTYRGHGVSFDVVGMTKDIVDTIPIR